MFPGTYRAAVGTDKGSWSLRYARYTRRGGLAETSQVANPGGRARAADVQHHQLRA
jgi:hypothetical protein